MASPLTEPLLAPLARVLQDTSVATIFLNGPTDVQVERLGRNEPASLTLSEEEYDRLCEAVLAQAQEPRDPVQASGQLPGGLHALLVRRPGGSGPGVLVLSRERPRPRGIEASFGEGDLAEAMQDRLQATLAGPRGVLVVGPTPLLRGVFLFALVEELPATERTLLIDRGLLTPPRHPHLVRLVVDEAAGATRARLVATAGGLRAQRLVLDGLDGGELGSLLLGEPEGAGPLVGVAGASLAAGLERLTALARIELGSNPGVDSLLRARFELACCLAEGPRRRPVVLEVAQLTAGPQGELQRLDLALRQRADEPLRLARPSPSPVTPPAPAPAEARRPLPRTSPGTPRESLGPEASGTTSRSTPPPATRLPADPLTREPTAAAASPPSPPALPTPPPLAPVACAPPPLAPPPPAGPAWPPTPPGPVASALRTVAVTRPAEQIFDEMLSSLQDLPQRVQTPPTRALVPPEPLPEAEEIDDSLLYGSGGGFSDEAPAPGPPRREGERRR
ncbi:MAG: hypothetical protein RBU45_07710 [Myxococcota bacterium]|jgi:type IV secretory pathway ATPase VirB11/archaellum biosynthesis ATPase|nr:hypothetical protein [Myxococcota bacterium]